MAALTPTKSKDVVITFNDGTDLILEYTGDFSLVATRENTDVEILTNIQTFTQTVENSAYDDYEITLLPSATVRTRLITAKEAGTACTLSFVSTVPVGDTINDDYNVKVKNVGAATGSVDGYADGMPVTFRVLSVVTP